MFSFRRKLQKTPLPPEIHLWTCDRSQQAPDIAALWSILSSDEQVKAKQLARPLDQEQAIISRGVLRTLLGRYLNIAPAELRFCEGPHGKPALADIHPDMPAFNISHSAGILLAAFGPAGTHIGVDIEQHRNIPEWMDIAKQHFHPEEIRELLAEKSTGQLEGFFNCWTCKEAVVKALGTGISMDLRSFRVPIQSGFAEYPVKLPAPCATPACTLVPDIRTSPGFSAALACCGKENHLEIRHLRFDG